MAFKINDKCTSCSACASACPAEAIKQAATQYEIDLDVCIECGACVDTCPVGAIIEA